MISITNALSPAQGVGYAALVLGIAAFVQRSDTRLKFLNGCQSMAYALHFGLLGNYAASASAFLSGTRGFLSIRPRPLWVMLVMLALTAAGGSAFIRGWVGLFPVIGSTISTYAAFRMRGIPMRLVFLASTFMWLANNLLSGSYGGSVLECFILTANSSTIIRMHLRARREARRAATREQARV